MTIAIGMQNLGAGDVANHSEGEKRGSRNLRPWRESGQTGPECRVAPPSERRLLHRFRAGRRRTAQRCSNCGRDRSCVATILPRLGKKLIVTNQRYAVANCNTKHGHEAQECAERQRAADGERRKQHRQRPPPAGSRTARSPGSSYRCTLARPGICRPRRQSTEPIACGGPPAVRADPRSNSARYSSGNSIPADDLRRRGDGQRHLDPCTLAPTST